MAILIEGIFLVSDMMSLEILFEGLIVFLQFKPGFRKKEYS